MKTNAPPGTSAELEAPFSPSPDGPPSLKLGRILVPSDFSGKSRQALKAAIPLAQRYGGRIFLLHTIQPALFSAWEIIPGGDHYANMDVQAWEDVSRERLGSLMKSLVPRELHGRILVCQGDPATEITAAAAKYKIDLIVISTHGYTGVRRVLIGSVTERVVRHAPCPVLTVRRT